MFKVCADVLAFHDACDVPTGLKPEFNLDRLPFRLRLIDEEHIELHQAAEKQNLPEFADAIGDLIYVLVGTALEFGIPLPLVWAAIQNANMAKVDAVTGKVIRREDGKILKPEGWVAPDIAKILEAARLEKVEDKSSFKTIVLATGSGLAAAMLAKDRIFNQIAAAVGVPVMQNGTIANTKLPDITSVSDGKIPTGKYVPPTAEAYPEIDSAWLAHLEDGRKKLNGSSVGANFSEFPHEPATVLTPISDISEVEIGGCVVVNGELCVWDGQEGVPVPENLKQLVLKNDAERVQLRSKLSRMKLLINSI